MKTPERILEVLRANPRLTLAEVAGYREVLDDIHLHYASLRLSTKLILQWHRTMYRYTGETRGEWKTGDNAIVELRPDDRQVVRFRPG